MLTGIPVITRQQQIVHQEMDLIFVPVLTAIFTQTSGRVEVCGTTMPLHHIQLLLLHMFVFSFLTPLMRLSEEAADGGARSFAVV